VEQPDLVRTTDATFRPIDVKLGPDGALYVADGPSPATDRGEAGTRAPPTGRIWRISRKDAKPLIWEPLLGKKNEELVEKIKSKSSWERTQARISLRRSLEVNNAEVMTSGSREPADAAMGLLSVFNERAGMMTHHSDDRVRAVAIREQGTASAQALQRDILAGHRTGDLSAFPWLWTDKAAWVADRNPRIRLEAMRYLSRIVTTKSAELILDAALKTPENDPHYDFAAWQSINDLAQPWTDAIASGAWKTEGHEAQLAYGLRAIDPALAGATLSRLFAAGRVPVDGSGPWIELIGDIGGPIELQRLLDGLLAGYVGDCCETDETHAIDTMLGLPGPAVGRATAALLTAARVRGVRPAAHAELVTALFHAQNEIASGAIELAGWWKAPDAVEKIGELLDSRETPPPLRRAAVDGLRAIGGEPALAGLNRLTNSDEAAGTRSAALIAIAQVQLDAAVARAVEVLPTLPESVLLETWRGLLGVKGAADAFATRLNPETAKSLPAPVLAAGLRAAREAGKPAAKLLDALSAGK
jgi:hypothetical protein